MSDQLKQCYCSVSWESPHTPAEVRVCKYVVPNKLGKTELEEAAARVLYHSKILGRWVGVSWTKIINELQDEFEMLAATTKAKQENQLREAEYQQAVKSYDRKLRWSLRLYALCADRPTLELIKVPDGPDVQFSVAHMMGPTVIVKALRQLITDGMLLEVEEDDETYFLPTLKLVEAIM